VDWKDVQAFYKEGLQPGEVYSEHDLHTLVDFMDLQGVVMHNNAEVLRDLVIIDQDLSTPLLPYHHVSTPLLPCHHLSTPLLPYHHLSTPTHFPSAAF
jgi:hypothetical protein